MVQIIKTAIILFYNVEITADSLIKASLHQNRFKLALQTLHVVLRLD